MTAESFPIIFPPMDEAVFAAKLAKWNARGPKQPKRGSIYAPRVRKTGFYGHVQAQGACRFAKGRPRP